MSSKIDYDPGIPYNDLPLLPPSEELETTAILKKTISASRALSELKGAVTNLPNPTLFIDTINLQEARASSAIENIITTQDELFKASIADKKYDNPATKEVMHYKDALWYGFDQIKRKPLLTTNLFIAIMRIVKENESGIRNAPGTQLKNPVTNKVIYTPPEGEGIIREKLKNLEDFIHAEDGIDPLVKMAVIHYQFEAIHPFFDGNGRTGRIILLLYLKLTGLLDLPALYLSSYIIEHRDQYYAKLRKVTEDHHWEGWILYMLDMVEQTALRGRNQIADIEKLMNEMGLEIQEKLPRVYSKDLLEILFKLPYTKRTQLERAGLGSLKTVGNYLKDLEDNGFLKSEQVGKEKLYLNFRLLTILKG
ncbi:Fic family protein [Robertkochia marina]|uniref:Fic family protein n=1 Tax=Robertkochia marina TaxID=1227945 RepID=A0A4S3LYF2_9FLAO|nr:Fic/DOC family N-terminal domain-containing protein [Robertkochia marina]THD66630.1 Fic family protein [Robertkochia marina]TRZ45531.1 Fic family protein [Robertkochia marina]